MAAERIIGVDFGTSTSVIRVKRYKDGKPVGGRLEVKPVKFNMGKSEIVPTLIQKIPSGGTYLGYEAEISHGKIKTETFQNFKINIDNPDEDIRRRARELTAEFFKHLGDTYNDQSRHLGEPDDRLRTIISYPVKWSDEAKAFLVRTAKDAGFPNVEGVDEAQAAIRAVTVQNADLGYFQEGVPINILLIDMGAGTTDLVLCRHTPGEQTKPDILSTWPQGGNALFGGQEVDELLRSYISQAIPKDIADQVLPRIGIGTYKAWKEATVSPALKKGEAVDYFSELDKFLDVMDIEAEYSVSRDSFENFAADYLLQFPELVNGCVSAAGLRGDNVDLVILTGGHSQWYFVREMLSGKLDRFGEIGLGKIQADPERIIPITLPQETVALGLVYGPLKIDPLPPPPPPPSDVFPLKYDPYSRIRPVIAVGGGFKKDRFIEYGDSFVEGNHIVGLTKYGTAIAIGNSSNYTGGMHNWRDMVAVAAGRSHTVCLKTDGTVLAFGNNEKGQCDVYNWRDIVAVAAGRNHTVGLKKDGTVIEVGDGRWGYVNGMRDIVAIAASENYTVGLKKDGTAITTGRLPSDPKNWRDIVAIAAGKYSPVGLKKDGTVVGARGAESWQNIVAIAAGDDHTVGLKKDGTVVAVGPSKYGYDVDGWRDIVAIAAGEDVTVGLKKDGTVVVAGGSYFKTSTRSIHDNRLRFIDIPYRFGKLF